MIYGKAALEVISNNFPEYDELDVGDDCRVNHSDCPAGVDSRSRLGIKRIDSGYIWHCFNCSGSGFARTEENISRLIETSKYSDKTLSYSPTIKWQEEYENAQSNFDKFSIDARMWLASYGFLKAEVYMCAIKYDDMQQRVYIPCYEGLSSYTGWQARNLNVRNTSIRPKYVTYGRAKFSYLKHPVSPTRRTLFIVEDLLSSYKLWLAGADAISLLGTSLKTTIDNLPTYNLYDRVVLWLDDDAAGQTAAIKLSTQLSPIYPNMSMVMLPQPKEMDMDTLKGMI